MYRYIKLTLKLTGQSVYCLSHFVNKLSPTLPKMYLTYIVEIVETQVWVYIIRLRNIYVVHGRNPKPQNNRSKVHKPDHNAVKADFGCSIGNSI